MKISNHARQKKRTVIIGAGMAGLSSAICLAAVGEEVVLLETRTYPGGKMRALPSEIGGIDSGPTVFTMKYVFDDLFDRAGENFERAVELEKAAILARHAWDDKGRFDLFANRGESHDEIARYFGKRDAQGYDSLCSDARQIFNELKDTFIGGQRPGPIELGKRVGLTRFSALLQLQPFTPLMRRLGRYFPDPRLQQLFGRYATYVGSSPYVAPATLMLIAHVEQEGVWMIRGGMHVLAQKLRDLAIRLGVLFRAGESAAELLIENAHVAGVLTASGEIIAADRVIFCGDVSALAGLVPEAGHRLPPVVKRHQRSLSAITWSMDAQTQGFPLHRHNVFFSRDYAREFDAIFKRGHPPEEPTVYVCAQDRDDDPKSFKGQSERLLCLVNAPANGDETDWDEGIIEKCQRNMIQALGNCGLRVTPRMQTVTTPTHFNRLFPGSGGALYGRASHGWMASFARPGAKTRIPGLYLAGGSVHPGPGVPMATRSGMLAAEQIIKDRVST